MKAFITGATGFIGGRLAQKLRDRGDEVVCLVRSPEKARDLEAAGCTIVNGDLSDEAAIRSGVEGCDAVFHVAADYRVGLKAEKRPNMHATNVGGTTRVLDAAIAAGAKRIVYVSSVVVFGNTRGEVVDETYSHRGDGFTSYYEETKLEAHQVAKDRIANGAPIVIVQPGGVYGPGDHSVLGKELEDLARGRFPALAFPDLGFNMVHVDDVVDGILLAHDKGAIGESYVLGGELTDHRRLIDKAAEVTGRRRPRTIPTALIKSMVPLAPIATKVMGLPPNMKELVSTSDGVTFWGKDDKARRELGYAPRDLDTGLRETLKAG